MSILDNDRAERAEAAFENEAIVTRELRAEIERLRALLKHADDVVIWEHTPARSGFQEEVEEALGIGVNEQNAEDR